MRKTALRVTHLVIINIIVNKKKTLILKRGCFFMSKPYYLGRIKKRGWGFCYARRAVGPSVRY